MEKKYELVERHPTVEEYLQIREAAGLRGRTEEAARKGIPGALYSICIVYDGKAVGMGRVVGDGGTCFDVVDIAVVPEHQGKGLGGTIMNAVMKFLHDNAPPSSFLSLVAEPGKVSFYEKYGFKTRSQESPGMSQLMK